MMSSEAHGSRVNAAAKYGYGSHAPPGRFQSTEKTAAPPDVSRNRDSSASKTYGGRQGVPDQHGYRKQIQAEKTATENDHFGAIGDAVAESMFGK
jgi:hypothetical protein